MTEKVLEIKELDELQKAIDYMLTNFNDDAEDALKKTANSFKRSVVQRTPVGTQKKSSGKKLKNGFRVSQVKGGRKDKFVEITSISPHFHLVERGHEIYDRNGKPTGKRTKPTYMMKRTVEEYETRYPEELQKMIVKLGEKAKKRSKNA